MPWGKEGNRRIDFFLMELKPDPVYAPNGIRINYPVGKMSGQKNVCLGIVRLRKCPVGKVSVGESSDRGNVQ